VGLRVSALVLASAAAVVMVVASSCATSTVCAFTSDCALGYYCNASGHCVRNCVVSSRDCDPGYMCDQNGHCVPASDGAPPDGSSPDGMQMDTGPGDVTSDPDVMGTTGTKIELDLCASDSECKTGLLCRALYKSGPTRCTPTCTSSSQCRSGARCVMIGADTYCADEDVGRACSTMSPGTCNYACVSPGYCTTLCTTGADCPNGYGCALVSSQKVCVRAEQYCGSGAMYACTSLDCDTSILASGCTLPCSAASDCPQRSSMLAPWTCSTYCQRPSDVYGPLAQGDTASYACNGSNTEINLCNDAQHIDFQTFTIPPEPAITCPVSMSVDGSSGDVCVDTCRYAGGCAFGYECTGLGGIGGNRVDLCIPSHGSGEVGASCSVHGDCAFGYCTAASKCSRDCSADGLCPTGSTCTAVGGPNPTVEGITFKRCQ
jgi:hypothetical protein